MPSSASMPSPDRVRASGTAPPRRPDRPARNAAATVGPPSTISRVMPRSASASQHRGEIEPAVRARHAQHLDALGASARPRAPAARSASANTQIGRLARRADELRSRAAAASCAVEHDAHRRALRPCPGSRQVSCGSSDSTVPMPIRIASFIARIRCTRARAASPVIAAGLAARQARPCRRPRPRA